MRGITLAIGVCVLGVALGIGAQATAPPAGSMTGTVRDSKGAALVGARLSLVREGIIVSTRLSDSRGTFAFARVPANRYDLTVTLSGFSSFRTAIDVQAGHASTLDVIMTPASGASPTSPPPPSASSEAPIQLDALLQSARGDAKAMSLGGIAGGAPGEIFLPRPQWNTEGYDRFDDNAFRSVVQDPLSTFSIDVDTASYANVRRFLNAGQLPPPDAVRVEELINYFGFDYPAPAKDDPVSITTELAACPWSPTSCPSYAPGCACWSTPSPPATASPSSSTLAPAASLCRPRAAPRRKPFTPLSPACSPVARPMAPKESRSPTRSPARTSSRGASTG